MTRPPLFGGVVLADPIGCHYDSSQRDCPAKMAESARNLPKWQTQQISCQTPCQYGKKIFRIWHEIIFGFSACNARYLWYAQSITNGEMTMKRFYYGSDDGYDYSRDNRYGEVDDYVRFVQEWRKEQAEKAKKEQPPKMGVEKQESLV